MNEKKHCCIVVVCVPYGMTMNQAVIPKAPLRPIPLVVVPYERTSMNLVKDRDELRPEMPNSITLASLHCDNHLTRDWML